MNNYSYEKKKNYIAAVINNEEQIKRICMIKLGFSRGRSFTSDVQKHLLSFVIRALQIIGIRIQPKERFFDLKKNFKTILIAL